MRALWAVIVVVVLVPMAAWALTSVPVTSTVNVTALLTFVGPNSGRVGQPSTNFTVTLSGLSFNGSSSVTISDGNNGGTIAPSGFSSGVGSVTVTPVNGTSFTFTYTPTVIKPIPITIANAQGWTENPIQLTYSAFSATGQTVFVSGNGTDGPGCGLAQATPCKSLQFVCNAANFQFHGGDTIAINAASPLTINNPTPTNACFLTASNVPSPWTSAGPAGQGYPYGATVSFNGQNYFAVGNGIFGVTPGTSSVWAPITSANVSATSASAPFTVTSYGGSGPCLPLAGQTGGCAQINITGTTWSGSFAIFEVENVPFVTIQNMRIIGDAITIGSVTQYGACSPCFNVAMAVACIATNGGSISNCNFTNNEVEDMNMAFYVSTSSSANFAPPNFGSGLNNVSVTNNYVHTSARLLGGTGGVFFHGGGGGSSGPTTNLISGNYIAGVDGFIQPTSDGTYNGIVPPPNLPAGATCTFGGTGLCGFYAYTIFVGTWATLDEFNVVANSLGNATGCGNGYGNWTYQVSNVIQQFNEVYGMGGYPAWHGGCDQGAFDDDGNTVNAITQYNYGHDNQGQCVLFFNPITPWNNNTFRYNICENNGISNAGGIGMSLSGAGPVYVYNNTVYNTIPTAGAFGGSQLCTTGPGSQVPQGCGSHTPFPISVGFNNGSPQCPSGPSLVANNIFATGMDGANGGGTEASMIAGGGSLCSAVTFLANDYYPIGNPSASLRFYQVGPSGAIYFSLAAWAAVATGGEAGSIDANPGFVGPTPTSYLSPVVLGAQPSTIKSCYAGSNVSTNVAPAPTQIPAGPQNQPTGCPSGYKISSTSSPVIGTGVNITTQPNFTTLNVGTQDYYGNSIPHTHGTGFNMGSDGGFP